MTPVDRVVAALEGAGCRPRQGRSGLAFRCPAPGHEHGDRRPSGSLAVGDDDRVLLCCHRGHSADEIVVAIGLTLADLFPGESPATSRRRLRVIAGGLTTKRPAPPRPGRPEISGGIVAIYDYTNGDGEANYRVGRTHDKQFPTAHADPVHGWIWGHPPDHAKVLYGLPAVLDAVERGAKVFVVEGEKDSDNLNRAFPDRIDYVATTKLGGARSDWLPAYTETLRGASVVIVADKDADGRFAAAVAARALLPVATSIVIVESKIGKDASDHLDAGYGFDDFVVVAADDPVAAQGA